MNDLCERNVHRFMTKRDKQYACVDCGATEGNALRSGPIYRHMHNYERAGDGIRRCDCGAFRP